MKVIDIEGFAKCKENNTDLYGSAVIRYAENWADLMEKGMLEGRALIDIAERASHEADTEGITGFMYGAAVNILSQVWAYGEELRKWHNKEYGYAGDGVVNPAVLTIREV